MRRHSTAPHRSHTPFFNRDVSSNRSMTQQKHTDKRQPCTGMHPDRHDTPYTSPGSGHGISGTPPCGKSRRNHYLSDKKRTGIQTSGKSPQHDDTNTNGKPWGPSHELQPVCSPWHCQNLYLSLNFAPAAPGTFRTGLFDQKTKNDKQQ